MSGADSIVGLLRDVDKCCILAPCEHNWVGKWLYKEKCQWKGHAAARALAAGAWLAGSERAAKQLDEYARLSTDESHRRMGKSLARVIRALQPEQAEGEDDNG